MNKIRNLTEFQPGLGFTKEDWDAVCDNPPWTEEELKNARPFREVFPELAASMDRDIAARNGQKTDQQTKSRKG